MEKRTSTVILAILVVVAIIFTIMLINTYEETYSERCTPEQEDAQTCTHDNTPICGDNAENYANVCEGCSSGEIRRYRFGEC